MFYECVPALLCGPSLDRRGHLRQVFPICHHCLLVGQRLLQVSLVVRNTARVVWCVLRVLEADHSFPLLASPREQVADSLSHSRGRSLQRSLPLNHVLPRTTRCTTETHAVVPDDPLDTSVSQSQQTQAPKRLSAGPRARRGGPATGVSDSSTVPRCRRRRTGRTPRRGCWSSSALSSHRRSCQLCILPPQIQFKEFFARSARLVSLRSPFCSAFAASPSSSPHVCDHSMIFHNLYGLSPSQEHTHS